MRQLKFALLVALMLCFVQAAAGQTASTKGRTARGFQGKWRWAIYTRNRSELPPAYRDMKLSEVPRYSLDLTLRQRGNKLTGEYGATARFLAKLEEGDLTSTIRGDTARIELESGFTGRVTVALTRRGAKLYWKIIKAEGEHYFPDNVLLSRVR